MSKQAKVICHHTMHKSDSFVFLLKVLKNENRNNLSNLIAILALNIPGVKAL